MVHWLVRVYQNDIFWNTRRARLRQGVVIERDELGSRSRKGAPQPGVHLQRFESRLQQCFAALLRVLDCQSPAVHDWLNPLTKIRRSHVFTVRRHSKKKEEGIRDLEEAGRSQI
jgi:hypothetical protein